MLVRSKLAEESEEDMQGLDGGLIIRLLVHGDIDHGADYASVVWYWHIDVGTRELDLPEGLLHLRVPLLH